VSKKRFLHARPFLALGLLVGAWVVLPVALQSLARVSFYEFQAPAEFAASRLRDLQTYWGLRLHSEQELIKAGSDLAQTNARYELTIRQNEALREELGRLERLLSLPARETHRYEVARVVRREFSAWWQFLVVGKGQNYGIPKGAPVVFTGGVVGIVREVRAYTSIVEILSGEGVRLAANFEGDNRPVAFRGGPNPGFGEPRGTVEFVPGDIAASPVEPALLVTSGLGGVFPPGLVIGRVLRLTPAPDGQFMEGEVVLDDRLASLREVAILVPVEAR
jgi:rod shape-determining protein MreC